jgi:thiamine phosphate synthase YjbQ (UPF0047 family)
MDERLYCPDFSAVFGEDFRNPFDYPLVDCLVWPLFDGEKFPSEVTTLLEITRNEHPLFYRRRITLGEFAVEQQCGNAGLSILQAMDIGQDYGIPNSLVQQVVNIAPSLFSGIYAVNLAGADIPQDLLTLPNIAGVVVYPTLCRADLTSPNEILAKTIGLCQENDLPLKIDLGNNYLPDNDRRFVDPREIDAFAAANPDLSIILSGPDPGSSELLDLFNLVKYRRNVAIEVDPRPIGGMPIVKMFNRIFASPGVVQNCWGNLLIGSATPTLELSQIVRGLWGATESLPLSFRHLIRIWGFRNAHRWYKIPALQTPYTGAMERPKAYTLSNAGEITRDIGAGHVDLQIVYDLLVESFSITQFLWLQPALDDLLWDLQEKYPEYKDGEILVRTKHTTTSLLLNEHEPGNYLDLHYTFVERTMADPSLTLHTTAAEEHRADFNFPDHLTASSYGQRDITIPFVDGKFLLGSRENLYLLSTFGPRSMHLAVVVKLRK